ncbi:hypothetical protein ILUMI_13734 [Ignelater luminosus]|uniref:Uncharacterized protein n=1 Tax=Ignelater luminosus TaxID=2038154 RepID=A0A8K0CW69_IGNLU|nr:hypothetical protein ILUMI_13734 [Ignelater luminosus]
METQHSSVDSESGSKLDEYIAVHKLLRQKTHSLETIRKHRKGIPKEIVTIKLSKGEVTKEDEKGVIIAK